jgi:hypothetical protein
MNRKNTINSTWSSSLAYVIGVIASDGCLSKDGRHIEISSKDEQLILTLRSLLKLKNKIGVKARGGSNIKDCFRLQFGSVSFYEFLLKIGLTPAKSKTIGELSIPELFFFDFLRGCIDGDGSITISMHPESKHSQLKLSLVSASRPFLSWIFEKIKNITGITGGWIQNNNDGVYVLCYGRADAIRLFNLMYTENAPCLQRKYILAKPYLELVM